MKSLKKQLYQSTVVNNQLPKVIAPSKNIFQNFSFKKKLIYPLKNKCKKEQTSILIPQKMHFKIIKNIHLSVLLSML